MKLRFHNNSLQFRLNQLEVTQLVSGVPLNEQLFPNTARPFCYSMSIHDAPAKVETDEGLDSIYPENVLGEPLST
jgi:hypothetical protein